MMMPRRLERQERIEVRPSERLAAQAR